MGRMSCAARGLTLGLVLALLAGPARAEEDDVGEAKGHFELGNQRFREGRFDDAIRAFRRANALVPDADLLFNIAQAYRRKGDCVLALRHYREFLREKPAASNRDKVEERIVEMEQCRGSTDAEAPSPVEIEAAPEPSPAKPPEGTA